MRHYFNFNQHSRVGRFLDPDYLIGAQDQDIMYQIKTNVSILNIYHVVKQNFKIIFFHCVNSLLYFEWLSSEYWSVVEKNSKSRKTWLTNAFCYKIPIQVHGINTKYCIYKKLFGCFKFCLIAYDLTNTKIGNHVFFPKKSSRIYKTSIRKTNILFHPTVRRVYCQHPGPR